MALAGAQDDETIGMGDVKFIVLGVVPDVVVLDTSFEQVPTYVSYP